MSPARPKLADPGALIRNAKLRTGEFRVCTDPELLDEYQRLILARDAAKDAAKDSLSAGATGEIEAQIAKALKAVEDATVTLVFRALPRPQFRALIAEHPQRKDAEGNLTHPLDALGFNFDSLFDALIRRSLVSPQLDEDTLSFLLEDVLNDQQYLDLTDVLWDINKSTVHVPFSPAVSPKTRSSSRR